MVEEQLSIWTAFPEIDLLFINQDAQRFGVQQDRISDILHIGHIIRDDDIHRQSEAE